MRARFWLLLAVVLALALTACGRVNIQRNASGGMTVTVTLTEADINAVVEQALAEENPLLRDPYVDLQNGAIVISGEHDLRNGQGRVSGTVTVTLSVEDGTLRAQITDVQIEGIDVSDEQVARLNDRLAEGFALRAGRDNRVITMTSVSVGNDSIELVFETEGQ